MKRRGAGATLLRRAFRIGLLRAKGARVTALVGASGTGKSFRAGLMAERRGFRIVIDDGMVIRESTVLAGHWSKKETSLQAATRRALFDEPRHAAAARAVLVQEKASALLVVGTSDRMVRRICRNLWLPPPSEVVRIEGVARPGEIVKATRRRRSRNAHASPVPMVAVRTTGLRGFLSRLVSRLPSHRARIEPPGAPGRGRVILSEEALSQMAFQCLSEYASGTVLTRLTAVERSGMYEISVHVVPPALLDAGVLHALRASLLGSFERHAGLLVRRLDLVIDGVTAEPRGPGARP